MSLRNDAKGQNTGSNSGSPETFIDTDLTQDYESGREFVRQRVKAFGAGIKDEMEVVQKAMKGFSGGKFVIAEATYQRPMLAPTDEQATQSVMSLLYSPSVEEVA
jgi:hypothetical protein